MKRFRFSLESVLTLRRFRKMEAAGLLAQASRRRQTAGRSLNRGRGVLQRVESSLRDTLASGGRAVEIVRIQEALTEQRATVQRLQKDFSDTLQREQAARQAVLEAQREYEALLKLETRQREAARKEAEREDEKQMQEFVAARHGLVRGG